MANTIRIKRSTGSSNPTSLENAEIAFREGDEVLVYGTGTGGSGGSATSIISIGGKGAFFDKATVRGANLVLSGPTTGSDAAPTFRSLVVADIPTLTASKISDFDTQVRTNRLDQLASATNTVSGVTPTADAHFATKGYVDSVSEGLDVKQSCQVATTANITIATALNSGDSIDGVTLANGDRVLVKDQSTATQNGIYVVGDTPVRADDLAAGADAAGAFTFVEQGSTNADIGFVCTSNKGSAVVGTNNLSFSTFSSSGNVTAGDGLDKSGNELSVDLKANGGLVIESTELAVDLAASSITGTLAIGDGGTGATSASAARTALGLAIGTNVQAYDADLANLSGCQSGASAALAALTESEVQILDGATLTTSELNLLDGVTATTSELNFTDGVTSIIQTQLNNKQPLDAELTELATMASGTASALADLTGTECQILDGATITTTELNIIDGNTSATSTTLASADRMVMNDAGTMKQVALSDLVTFLEDESTSGFDIDGGSY